MRSNKNDFLALECIRFKLHIYCLCQNEKKKILDKIEILIFALLINYTF